MIIGSIYFGIFSMSQIPRFGYGFMILYLLIGFPFYKAICKFQDNQLYLSIISLLLVVLGVIGLIMTRIWTPWLFKPLFIENICNNSVMAYLQH